MLTSMEFPNQYIQGSGALKSNLAAQIRTYGQKALVVSGSTADTMLSGRIFDAGETDLMIKKLLSVDECTQSEINRIRNAAKECCADCIVALGGPKLLDAAKVAANDLRLPIIISPIPVASDTTSSNIAVIYSPEGTPETYMQLKKCVDVIIVDLELLVKSPARFLVSAMGSTLPAWFEAEFNRKTGVVKGNGFLPSVIAYDLGWLCYETLLEYGPQAKLDCEAEQITEALKRIAEISTVVSGICFSSIGVAAPHAIYNGLTLIKQTHKAYQGEKLAFATLASLYLNNAPAEIINDVYSFCISVGLPTTFRDIGIADKSNGVLMRIAKHAFGRTQGMPEERAVIAPETVMEALLQADHEGMKRRHAAQEG